MADSIPPGDRDVLTNAENTTAADLQEQLAAARAALAQRNHQLRVFDEIAHSAHMLHDVPAILDSALTNVVEKLGLEWGAMYADDGGEQPEVRVCRNSQPTYSIEIENIRQRVGRFVAAEVIRSSTAVIVRDLRQDERFRGLWDTPELPRSYASIPLRLDYKAAPPTVMELVSRAGRPFSDPDIQILQLIANATGNAVKHAILLAEARQRELEMNTLYQQGAQIYACLDIPHIAAAIAEAARDLLQTDLALVGLLDENQNAMVVEGVAGAGAETLLGMHLPTGDDAIQEALDAGRPLLTDLEDAGMPVNRRVRRMVSRRASFFLAAPLRQCDRVLGTVGVITHGRGPFSQHERELLEWLSQGAAIAVENARLSRNTLNLAVLEERDRLAREMHDNVAQTLGYIKMSAATAETLLEHGEVAAAQRQLREVQRSAHESYTDVRQSIFNLRTTVSAGADFLPSLREYLASYQAHYGVTARLEVEDGLPINLSSVATLQIGRVVQEALANVRKHARASQVSIRIQQTDRQLRITLKDNGTGFEPASIPAGGARQLGLEIMRERIAGIGGQLDIVSRPGEGTQVVIVVEHRA